VFKKISKKVSMRKLNVLKICMSNCVCFVWILKCNVISISYPFLEWNIIFFQLYFQMSEASGFLFAKCLFANFFGFTSVRLLKIGCHCCYPCCKRRETKRVATYLYSYVQVGLILCLCTKQQVQTINCKAWWWLIYHWWNASYT